MNTISFYWGISDFNYIRYNRRCIDDLIQEVEYWVRVKSKTRYLPL